MDSNPDPFLNAFVNEADESESGASIRVTLLTSGGIVAGNIVSIREYNRHVERFLEGKLTIENDQEAKSEEFIHLADVVVLDAGATMNFHAGDSGELSHVRIRQSEIVGWMFGGVLPPTDSH